MKICSMCKEEKDESDFYVKKEKGEQRLYSQCKQCHNDYCMKRWVSRKIKVIEQFGGICHDCKNTYPYQVFEFHHLDPHEKDFDWSKMRLQSEIKMQNELSKCVMLCANCHRIRHA